MTGVVRSSAQVMAALWVGGLFCLGLVVAPYLFILAARSSPAVPNTGVAAELVGPLLYGSDIVSLVVACGLLAAVMFLRRRGEEPLGGRCFVVEIVVAVAAVCAAANYWWVTPRLQAAQADLTARYGAFHVADRGDPAFLRFNELHQRSTTLFLMGLGAALIGLVCMTRFRSGMR